MSITRDELDLYWQTLLGKDSEDVCVNGLQIEGSQQIEKIAFAVTATEKVILEAIDQKASALFVHHGLFWKSLPRLCGALRRKVALMLSSGMNLFAYHLPLDSHKDLGNNWPVAKSLGLSSLEPFGQFLGQSVGVIGSYEVKKTAGQLAEEVKEFYQLPQSCFAIKDPKKNLRRVAICSGGGNKELERAIACGADALITGCQDEPQWHTALEEGIAFLPVGHHRSEKVGPKKVQKDIEKHFESKVQTLWIEDDCPY